MLTPLVLEDTAPPVPKPAADKPPPKPDRDTELGEHGTTSTDETGAW